MENALPHVRRRRPKDPREIWIVGLIAIDFVLLFMAVFRLFTGTATWITPSTIALCLWVIVKNWSDFVTILRKWMSDE